MTNNIEEIRKLAERGKDIAESFEQEQNDPIAIVCNAEALQGIFNELLSLFPKSDSITSKNCIYCGQCGNELIAIDLWVVCIGCFKKVFDKVLKEE